jgi:hypothetical protein
MSAPTLSGLLLAAAALCVSTSARSAETPDPCTLLSVAERSELGVPADAPVLRDKPAEGVSGCSYQAPGLRLTMAVVAAESARILQFRALIAKTQGEHTQAELALRGEHYADGVICKVVSGPAGHSSQCMGVTQRSLVMLALVRPGTTDTAAVPTQALRLTTELVARAAAGGG